MISATDGERIRILEEIRVTYIVLLKRMPMAPVTAAQIRSAQAVLGGCIPVNVSTNTSRQPEWRSRMIFNLSVKKFTEVDGRRYD
jgi:hypothetical protein